MVELDRCAFVFARQLDLEYSRRPRGRCNSRNSGNYKRYRAKNIWWRWNTSHRGNDERGRNRYCERREQRLSRGNSRSRWRQDPSRHRINFYCCDDECGRAGYLGWYGVRRYRCHGIRRWHPYRHKRRHLCNDSNCSRRWASVG